jgi:hypothetical protein
MSGNSIYKNDPYTLEIQYGKDLSAAVTIQVRMQDPDGVITYVTGTQYQGTKIRYSVTAAQNNKAGDWIVHGAVDFGNGVVHGDGFILSVKNVGTVPSTAGA